MNSADLIKLARLFEDFVELKTCRVLVSDIKAVRKKKQGGGLEIVTPDGVFQDDEDYDAFNQRMKDTLELIKSQKVVIEKPVPPQGRVVSEAGHVSLTIATPGAKAGKVVVLPENQQPDRKFNIPIGEQGTRGYLFGENSNLQIGDRSRLYITDPNGVVIARADAGSAVKGEGISGFIHTNGKYTLSFTPYAHKTAIVVCSVIDKPKLPVDQM